MSKQTNSLWLPSKIIDDSNSSKAIQMESTQMGVSCGYVERESDYLEDGVCAAFPEEWLIPESEWPERIIEREREGWTNRQLREKYKLPPLHQNGTNYCWGNCCTQALHYNELKQGRTEWTPMSPASACARIKRGANEGGWMMQWIKWVLEHGINEAVDFPVNSRDIGRYDTKVNREKAKLHIMTEFLDLVPKGRNPSRAFQELISCLLRGIPVAIALMWWRHAVLAIDAVLKNGEVGILIDNSHGPSYGDNGLAAFFGTRKIPDDQEAILVSHLMTSHPAKTQVVA